MKNSSVPEFMQPFVNAKPAPKENIAINNVITLNDVMFTLYDKSLANFAVNFLNRHPLIMALFSGKGGRYILYRPGQPPQEAESAPVIYQLTKSVGHCAMALFQVLAPCMAHPSEDLSWLGTLLAYRANVQKSLNSLDAIEMTKEERELLQDTLNQIAALMDKCIKNRTYTYDEVQNYSRTIKPNLAKLIDVATNVQVKHGWKVIEKWKEMLGKEWDKTYGLSNSIYVARQNNILYSILVQFFGEKAMNDRLLLLETTDFTTTPEFMLNAFIRIVSDRMIGQVFFNNPQLMDFELLGGSARKVIEAEAKRHGQKPLLPPLVPYNSHQWPMKTDTSSGSGPRLMEEVQ